MWIKVDKLRLFNDDANLLIMDNSISEDDLKDLVFMEGKGYLKMQEVAPVFDASTQKVFEMPPVIVDGQLLQQWKIAQLDFPAVYSVEESVGQRASALVASVQAELDKFAQTRHYDSINSLVSYVGDHDETFDSEGRQGKILRGLVWRKTTEIVNDAMAGLREIPATYHDISEELPSFVWTP
jgi:hypothetical protein